MMSTHGLDAAPEDATDVRMTTETIERMRGRLHSGYYIVPDGEPSLRLDDEDASRVVESLILRLPIPATYLVERRDGRFLALSANIAAVYRFVRNGFALSGLRGLRAYLNGKRWNDLAAKIQNRILDAHVVLAIIHTPWREAVVLDILQRSQDRLFLHRQAIRHMVHPGSATAWIREAAASDVFLQATGRRFSPDTMDDCEAVLRFCACFLHGIDGYIHAGGDIDSFLGATLDILNRDDPGVRHDLMHAFRRSMRNNIVVFGDQDGRWGRASLEADLALFEVCAVVLAPLGEDFIREHRDSLREAFHTMMNTPEFVHAITTDPHHPDNVRARFEIAIDVCRAIVAAADASGGIAFARMVGRPGRDLALRGRR